VVVYSKKTAVRVFQVF